MTRSAMFLVTLFWLAPPAAAADDIEVSTSISRTALWVGSMATYTVTLVCRSGVDVLQEDFSADKLPLTGLQSAGQRIDRSTLSDGRIRYVVSYQLRTFETATEMLSIGDWTVRYVTGAPVAGQSAPAAELRIPGLTLAWRSALPAAINSLDRRDARAPDPAPRWWRAAGAAGYTLLAISVAAFAAIVTARVKAGRRPKPTRRIGKQSAREFQSTLSELRHTSVTSPEDRRRAYGMLDAAVRRRAGDMAEVPGTALTPAEFEARLSARSAPLSTEALTRILTECQRARYQPADRLAGEQDFHATVDAAERLFAPPSRGRFGGTGHA